MKSPLRTKLYVLIAASLISSTSSAKDYVGEMLMKFAQSEIVFQRAESNAPFVPVAFAEYKAYNDTEVVLDNQQTISIDQTTFAQSAVLPILASSKDIVFIGEWMNNSHIVSDSVGFESFSVTQAALPLGWLRQLDSETQMGGFIAPLGYKASLEGSNWDWQTLGGLFGRHVYSDNIWWAFGAYFDVGGIDDTYLPYLGANWQIDEKWTISAIMPWPAVLFAPSKDTLFRFGASPSGSSWKIDSGSTKINQEISGWDFGIAAEQHIQKGLWFKLEAGLGGLRALRVRDGVIDTPDLKVDASSYIKLGINFRPTMN